MTEITTRVKTFEDACTVLAIEDPQKTLYSQLHDALAGDDKAITAFCKLIIIARALNQGWTPDWNDSHQWKWFPWFRMKPGFGFSSTSYGAAYTDTRVGSRLCFQSDELAEYAGKQFEEIYKDLLTL